MELNTIHTLTIIEAIPVLLLIIFAVYVMIFSSQLIIDYIKSKRKKPVCFDTETMYPEDKIKCCEDLDKLGIDFAVIDEETKEIVAFKLSHGPIQIVQHEEMNLH